MLRSKNSTSRKRLFKKSGANATVHVRIFDLLQTKMRHVWRCVATGVSDLFEKPARVVTSTETALRHMSMCLTVSATFTTSWRRDRTTASWTCKQVKLVDIMSFASARHQHTHPSQTSSQLPDVLFNQWQTCALGEHHLKRRCAKICGQLHKPSDTIFEFRIPTVQPLMCGTSSNESVLICRPRCTFAQETSSVSAQSKRETSNIESRTHAFRPQMVGNFTSFFCHTVRPP